MNRVVRTALCLSLVWALAAFAAPTPPAAPAADAAHVHAVQDLLQAMQIEKVLPGIAARSGYPSEAQRQAVYAKIAKVPPAEVYRRLAPQLASNISTDTATEMTRFYQTPYGKKVIYGRYNSSAQIMMPGMRASVPAEERNERKRPAYVQASTELATAEPAIQHEAFKLLQAIDKEKH